MSGAPPVFVPGDDPDYAVFDLVCATYARENGVTVTDAAVVLGDLLHAVAHIHCIHDACTRKRAYEDALDEIRTGKCE